MDHIFLKQRIEKAKNTIIAYEDALIALSAGNIQSYMIDTGQTKQTVTMQDIEKINNIIASLENKLATLTARINNIPTHVVPLW